jgi:negative regulator of flagellin synthesis FlgM
MENPMKIGSPIDTGAASGTPLRGARESGAACPTHGAKAASDKVSLSSMGAQMGAAGTDFDEAKVNEIREAIRAGRFTVNPEAIADALIDQAAALLGPRV